MAPTLLPALSALLSLLALAPTPSFAHSHLAHILINGELYHGYDPRPNQTNAPSHVAWSHFAADDGFVTPSNYSHPDIICHTAAIPPAAHAPVRAGDRIHMQWNGWPIGHVGPVLSYLAKCDSDIGCAGVNKTALRWTKVDDSLPVMEVLREGDEWEGTMPPGVEGYRWASDVLVAANNSWQVEVPRGLEGGAYVLRHEIVALHFAGERDGAQNYPVCVNLWVEGDGGEDGFEMDGFEATRFYTEDDPGILVNVSAALTNYLVPGPTVAVGATPVPYQEQTISLLKAEGTPVVVTRGTETETVPFVGEATATPTGGRDASVRRRYYGRE